MIGLQRLAIPSCPPAKCPPFSLVTPSGECVSHQSSVTLTLYTKQQTLFSTAPADLPAVIVVFIDILTNWGLLDIIKQTCHASVGILMECLPEGGWFSPESGARGKTILPLGDIPSGYPYWHGIFVYKWYMYITIATLTVLPILHVPHSVF